MFGAGADHVGKFTLQELTEVASLFVVQCDQVPQIDRSSTQVHGHQFLHNGQCFFQWKFVFGDMSGVTMRLDDVHITHIHQQASENRGHYIVVTVQLSEKRQHLLR